MEKAEKAAKPEETDTPKETPPKDKGDAGDESTTGGQEQQEGSDAKEDEDDGDCECGVIRNMFEMPLRKTRQRQLPLACAHNSPPGPRDRML